MGRKPCCDKEGLNRGAWSASEDKILTKYIDTHGEGKWRDLPQRAGLSRCGKSCRLRWLNYLRPDIKRGNISGEEEELIVKLHKLLGNRWSLIAGRLPGRTDNEIKNYWNTNLSKRSSDQGSDSKAPQDQDQPSRTNSKDNTNTSKSSNQVQVIRTKAFKCKNVVIPSHLDGHDQVMNKSPKLQVPAGNSDSESACSSGDGHLLDFDVNDVFISDILNSSDFHQAQVNECGQEMVDYGITKVEDLLMGEARVGNCDHDFKSNVDHHGGDIDLNALSSFLNLVDDDDEWLVS